MPVGQYPFEANAHSKDTIRVSSYNFTSAENIWYDGKLTCKVDYKRKQLYRDTDDRMRFLQKS